MMMMMMMSGVIVVLVAVVVVLVVPVVVVVLILTVIVKVITYWNGCSVPLVVMPHIIFLSVTYRSYSYHLLSSLTITNTTPSLPLHLDGTI
jgi:hypothetical protein